MQDPTLIQSWKQKFNSLGADGVDFVASPERNQDGTPAAEIYSSFTKEEFFQRDDYNYPRSHYVFWRRLFGEKCYI